MKPIRLLDLTPKALKAITARNPLLLIPIGTVEWHADHLPLGVDSLMARAFCEEISTRTRTVVAPLLTCGICRDLDPGRGYFGTINTVRESTLSPLITDLLQGYAGQGFKKAIIFSGHYETEHFNAITSGINAAKGIQGVFMSELDLVKGHEQELEDVSLTWPFAGDHAAEMETSLMLAFFPHLVHMNDAPETVELDMPGLPDYIRRRYPRRASRAYGNKLKRVMIRQGVEIIRKVLLEYTQLPGGK